MTDTPTPTIWPCLAYTDAPGAIRFLVEAFGFVETLVVPGEGGREIAHAELRWPEGGGVMLGSTSDAGVSGQMKPGTTSIYVVTDAPDTSVREGHRGRRGGGPRAQGRGLRVPRVHRA